MIQLKLEKGLTIHVKADGTWLNFSTEGKHASIRLETLAEDRRGMVGNAIAAWVVQLRLSEGEL